MGHLTKASTEELEQRAAELRPAHIRWERKGLRRSATRKAAARSVTRDIAVQAAGTALGTSITVAASFLYATWLGLVDAPPVLATVLLILLVVGLVGLAWSLVITVRTPRDVREHTDVGVEILWRSLLDKVNRGEELSDEDRQWYRRLRQMRRYSE